MPAQRSGCDCERRPKRLIPGGIWKYPLRILNMLTFTKCTIPQCGTIRQQDITENKVKKTYHIQAMWYHLRLTQNCRTPYLLGLQERVLKHFLCLFLRKRGFTKRSVSKILDMEYSTASLS